MHLVQASLKPKIIAIKNLLPWRIHMSGPCLFGGAEEQDAMELVPGRDLDIHTHTN